MTTWIALTPTQYRLLHRLARHPNQVITRDQLYHTIVNGETIIEPAQITWHISHLKSLAFSLSGHQLPIENVPARGYILNLSETSIILVPPSPEPAKGAANHETT